MDGRVRAEEIVENVPVRGKQSVRETAGHSWIHHFYRKIHHFKYTIHQFYVRIE